MPDFDDILTRATRRLRIDRELQWDVQEELRTHLEDAAGEFRDAGRPDEEADELAAKALGDPEAIAEQLWSANRGRVRLRAWARRGLQLTAPVALVLLALLIARQAVDSGRGAAAGQSVRDALRASPAGSLYAWMAANAAGMNEQRSEIVQEGAERALATAEQVPTNGAFTFLAARLRALEAMAQDGNGGWRTIDAAGMAEARRLLRRAAQSDSFEPGVAADADRVMRDSFDPVTAIGFLRGRTAGVAAVVDAQLTAMGQFRQATRLFTAHALELADAGQPDEALAVIDDLRTLSLKLIRDADMVMAMLVGVSMYGLVGESAAEVHRTIDDEAAAEQAAASREAFEAWYRETFSPRSAGRDVEPSVTLGVIDAMLRAVRQSVPGYAASSNKEQSTGEVIVERARRANELATAADRATVAMAALMLAAGVLLVVACAAWLLTVIAVWRAHRRGEPGPVLVLRWGRALGMLAVVGVGLVALLWGAMRLGEGWVLAWLPVACVVMVGVAVIVAWRVRRSSLPGGAWRSSAVRTFAAACGCGVLMLLAVGLGPILYEESRAVEQLQRSSLFLPGSEVERSRYAELAAWAGEQLEERHVGARSVSE